MSENTGKTKKKSFWVKDFLSEINTIVFRATFFLFSSSTIAFLIMIFLLYPNFTNNNCSEISIYFTILSVLGMISGFIFILIGNKNPENLEKKKSISFYLSKYKGYSERKNTFRAILFSFYFSTIIFAISLILKPYISEEFNNFLQENIFGIYNTMIFSFLALYATVLAITSNLSHEFPYKIALKYIVFSKASFFYSFSLLSNILFSYTVNIILSHNTACNFYENIQNSFMFISIILLFFYTLIFIFIILNSFKIEKYFPYFIFPIIKNYYNITKNWNNDNCFYNVSSYSSNNLIKINDLSTYLEIKSVNYSEKNNEKNIYFTEFENRKTGILGINESELSKLNDYKFLIKIDKYSFNPPASYYLNIITSKKIDKKEEEKLKKTFYNLFYFEKITFSNTEYDNAYKSLNRLNFETKLVEHTNLVLNEYIDIKNRWIFKEELKNYINKQNNQNNQNKNIISENDFKEILNYFKHIKKYSLETPLKTLNIVKAFNKLKAIAYENKYDFFFPNIMREIKGLFGLRLKENFYETENELWTNDYTNLLKEIANIFFETCEFFIFHNFDIESKYDYLNRNKEYYIRFFESYPFNNNQSTVDKEKKKADVIIYFKYKLITLIFLIMYKIGVHDLNKSFFSIALEIFQYKPINDSFCEVLSYNLYDSTEYIVSITKKIDEYIYNISLKKDENDSSKRQMHSDAKPIMEYLLILLFKNYISPSKNKSISSRNSIDFFPKECFKNDTLLDLINNLSAKDVKEFYDFEETYFNIFKKKLLESYHQKKEVIINDEIKYYEKKKLDIQTNKYIKKYKNRLEKAYRKKLARLSEFLQNNQISGNKINESLLDEYLRHRYWFLESRSDLPYIYKNIEEVDIYNLFIKKKDNILKKIDKRLKLANKTQSIDLKLDLIEQLSNFIKEGKKYVAFLSGDIFDSFKKVYNEPGNIIHTDKMHINFRNYDKFNIIFPENSFELVQETYEDNKILKIDFSKNITPEEFNKYRKKNKWNVKSGETLENFVKITVYEKYKLISKNLDDCFRLETENSEMKDEIVYISKNGKKYHRSNCRCLIKKEKKEIPLEEAKERYTPCSICNPPK